MTPTLHRIEVTLETLFDSVDLAESITLRVAEAAGFDEDNRYRIGMSVREGVINAVEFGNQFERDKKIGLHLELTSEKFVIHIRDQGPGFDLTDVANPLEEENLLRTSGRGIFLMRALMDEFELRRPAGGGAELVMAKRLPGAQPAAAQSPAGDHKEDQT